MEASKDIWDILEIIGALAAGIFIPIAIFWFGHTYNKRKEESDSKEREAERISKFLVHLTSENEQERILATKIIQYLHKEDQLPKELLTALETISITDETIGSIATNVLDSNGAQDFFEILSKLIPNLSIARTAIENYLENEESRIFKWIKTISVVNKASRNLLINSSHVIPNEYRESANSLIQHYNDWLDGYRNALSEFDKEPDLGNNFKYYRAPNYPFPVDAAQDFFTLYNSIIVPSTDIS